MSKCFEYSTLASFWVLLRSRFIIQGQLSSDEVSNAYRKRSRSFSYYAQPIKFLVSWHFHLWLVAVWIHWPAACWIVFLQLKRLVTVILVWIKASLRINHFIWQTWMQLRIIWTYGDTALKKKEVEQYSTWTFNSTHTHAVMYTLSAQVALVHM